MSKRRSAAWLAAAAIFFGSTLVEAQEPIRIAGVYRNAADACWVTAICAAGKEAARLGVEFDVYSIAINDNTQLSQILDTALLTKPQGLLFAPADSKTFSTKIAEIMAQGIPVIGESPQQPDTMWKVIQTSKDGSLHAEAIAAAIKDVKGTAVVLNGLTAESAIWRYSAMARSRTLSRRPTRNWNGFPNCSTIST